MKAKLIDRRLPLEYIIAVFQAADQQFTFRAGEYIQLILASDQKRYFSVMSSPNELPVFKIATRLGQSEFKKTLLGMPIGSEVEINGPWGDLFLPEDGKLRTYYFIAGGIGITPFMSMIKFTVEEGFPYKIHLLYFADPEPIFKIDLEKFAGRSLHTRVLFIHNRISAEAVKPKLLDDYLSAMFMVAGPPGFVNTALTSLRSLGISGQNIIFESYTGY